MEGETKVTTSIYFRDPTILARLEELAGKVGISVSSIVERMFTSTIDELEKKALKARSFKLDSEIKI